MDYHRRNKKLLRNIRPVKKNHCQIQQIWSYSNTKLSCPLSIVIISLAHASTHTRTRPASLLKQEGWVQPVKCSLPLLSPWFLYQGPGDGNTTYNTLLVLKFYTFPIIKPTGQQRQWAKHRLIVWNLCSNCGDLCVFCLVLWWCCFDFGVRYSLLLTWLKFVKMDVDFNDKGGMSLGFAWQDFGSGGGCKSSFYEKLPVASPMTDRATASQLQDGQADPTSGCGSAPGITDLTG